MTIREAVFAFVLAAAAGIIISGVWMLSEPAGRIAAGILGGLWFWLILAEDNQ